MKERLQQALAAIKDGDENQARLIVAQLLKEDPEYVPGWVLMSQLATSEKQKKLFLRRILASDPDHAYARQELGRLQAVREGELLEAETEVVADEPVPEDAEIEEVEAVDEDLAVAAEVDVVDEAFEEEAEEAELMVAPPQLEEGEVSGDAIIAEAMGDEEMGPEDEDLEVEDEIDFEAGADLLEEEVIEAEIEQVLAEDEDLAVAEAAEAVTAATVHESGPAMAEEADDFAAEGLIEFEEEGEIEEPIVAPTPATADPYDFDAQSEGDTLPPWLADEDAMDQMLVAEEEEGTDQSEAVTETEGALPGWLKEDADTATETETDVSGEPVAAEDWAQFAQSHAAVAEEDQGRSTWIVLLLAFLAVIVFLLVVYAGLTLL